MTEKLILGPKVLLVCNQPTTGPLWAFGLQQQKLSVVLEPVPANTIQSWEMEIPDLIVLDVNLPAAATLDLIRNLRAETIIPILLLTSVTGEDFVLEAYQAGADDCVLKPVSPSLFLAKIKVWLRRAWTIPADTLEPLRVGGMHLFPAERMVILRNGLPVHLTNLELRLLYYLMTRPGRTVTIEDLNQRVWGYASETNATMLKNVVYRLRRKIEADPSRPLIIQTMAGTGYRLAAE